MQPNDTLQLPLFTTAPNDTGIEIPYGYCHCGCGQPTRIARQSTTERGQVAGQPVRFISGHSSRKGRSVEQRFWAKVNKHGPVHPVLGTECWLWTGCTMSFGHGQINIGNHVIQLVHRFSYELHHGPIPEGLKVCHRCDNPPCIRLDHLFLGTQQDNVQDAIKKGRPGYLDWKRKTK